MSVDRAAAFVEHARRYAGLKWALTPCRGKDPFESGWQKSKPGLPDLAAGKWAESGKRWNIGIVCGPSGLAVLDVDHDFDPDAACLGLLGLDDFPDTPIVRTGRGRLQVYYRDPGGIDKKTRDGFELRVGPHQCIAPPSVHPDTGKEYEWLAEHAPWEVELADLPADLIAYFGANSNGKAAAAPIGEMIRIGEIDTTLASLAGTMRRRGMDENAIYAALVETLKRCEPGHTHTAQDCRRIAASIAKKEPAATPDLSYLDADPGPEERPPLDEPDSSPTGSGDAAPEGDDRGYGIVLVDPRQIEVKNVEWLVPGLLPKGQLAILQGHGSAGKGTLSCQFAAAESRKPGGFVLFVVAEDDYETMLKPRLIAAGADLSRIRFVDFLRGGHEDALRIPDDLTELDRAIREVGATLVVIDPLMSHLAANVESYKDHAVKGALGPLLRVANAAGCTILGVHHFTKNTDRGARHSGQASAAFGNTARIVLALAKTTRTTTCVCSRS